MPGRPRQSRSRQAGDGLGEVVEPRAAGDPRRRLPETGPPPAGAGAAYASKSSVRDGRGNPASVSALGVGTISSGSCR